MAIITAKFDSRCPVCGGQIQAGTRIEYTKGTPARHVKCEPPEIPANAIRVGRGEGYGGTPYTPKTVTLNSKRNIEQGQPEWLYILTASRQYVAEDGLSFGVGDESGYYYSAVCRPATPEEFAPAVAHRAAAEARRVAAKHLEELHNTILKTGERPDGRNIPDGETIPIGAGQTIYGGGKWFVIGPAWIWAVINNGSDGADWTANNVGTGGAGAIGKRVPYDAALAADITTTRKATENA